MIRSPRSIADYDVLFDPIRRARSEKSGQQAGDPAKAARAILKVVESNDPPMHLLLGSDALKLTRDKLNSLGKDRRMGIGHDIDRVRVAVVTTSSAHRPGFHPVQSLQQENIMNRPEKVIYTAKVHTTGGRVGSSRSDDGKLDVKLSRPGTLRGHQPGATVRRGLVGLYQSAMELVLAG